MFLVRHALLIAALALIFPRAGFSLPVVHGTILAPSSTLPTVSVELRPVAGSYELGLRMLKGAGDIEAVTVATPDPEGRFTLTVPQPGVWTVSVAAPGFAVMDYGPLVTVEDIDLPPVALPGVERLEVDVRRSSGESVPGALVLAEDSGQARRHAGRGWKKRLRHGRSNAAGQALLERATGSELTVTAVAPDGAVQSQAVVRGSSVTIVVPPAGGRLVAVRDEERRPLTDVLVRAGDRLWPVGWSGVDGRAWIPRQADGSTAAWLIAPDGRRGLARLDEAGEGLAEIELRMPEVFAGRVLDIRHRPIAGAVVWSGVDPSSFALTDGDGRYRLEAPTARRSWVQAEAPGYLPRAERVTRAHRETLRLPTLALEQPARLAGRVLDGHGAPLAGVHVEAIAERPRSRPFFSSDRADSRTVSDAQGRFLLPGLQPETAYGLRLERRGFATDRVAVDTPAPGLKGATPDLVLHPSRAVQGRVVAETDGEERPLEKVEVVLRLPDESAIAPAKPITGEEAFTARTDRDGRFKIAAAPAARVDIVAAREGFASMVVPGVDVPPGRDAFELGTLVLMSAASLRGRAVDREGAPLAGATVRLLKTTTPPTGTLETRLLRRPPDAVAAADGSFVLDGLRPGEPWSLHVHTEGYVAAFLAGVEAPVEEPLEVALKRALAIRGRVVDEDDRAVPGAHVDLTWNAVLPGTERRTQVGASISKQAVTDGRGRFEIAGLEPGDATLEVYAEGYAPPPVIDVEIPPDRDLDIPSFVLARGAVVEGRVSVGEDEPMAGVRVSAGLASARSDAEGHYRLEGVPLGRLALHAFHPAHQRQTQEVVVEAGGTVVDWTFAAGSKLRGRVTDEEGIGVMGALVELVPDPPYEVREYRQRTTADGTFELASVVAGPYHWRASKAGYADSDAAAPLTIGSGDHEDLDIVLTRGIAVVGEIEGLDFDELGRVRIEAVPERGRSRTGRVDYRGHFEIRDLAPGDWTVHATLDSDRRHAQASLSLPAGAREVSRNLRFGSGVTLTGRVLYTDEPLTQAIVSMVGHERSVHRTVNTDYRGEFSMEDLPPGNYRLEVQARREHLVHNQSLHLDDDRDILVELRAARLTGRVIEAADRPVPDALITLRRLASAADGSEEHLITGGADSGGFFEIPRVPPGRYRFGARKDGYATVEQMLEVPASGDLIDLELELRPTAGLELVVRLASGAVPPFANLQVLDADQRVIVRESRSLDAAGRARFSTVPPGRWSLLVSAPGGSMARARAAVPSSEPLSVVLPATGRLQVRVLDLVSSDLLATLRVYGADGSPLSALGIGGEIREQWQVRQGKAEVEGVPTGLWLVQVTAPDHRTWSSTVEIRDGAQQAVELP